MQPTSAQTDFRRAAERRGLSVTDAEALLDTVVPLAAWVQARRRSSGATIIGMSGAQGSGKSTLAALLAWYLQRVSALRVAVLSLDDIYLTRAARQRLAGEVHPLFATRGVPGTHEVDLGLSVLRRLRGDEGVVPLPRFDKATDDRAPDDTWDQATLPLDIVLFEGWCLGATPQSDDELEAPLNELERVRDADGAWRRAVNRALSGRYAELFRELDALVYLRVPSFAHVLEWRQRQEQELTARSTGGTRVMTKAQVRRFVCHFERLTRHMLRSMPGLADLTVEVGENHGFRVDLAGPPR